jgi:hypothetical protein
MGDTTVESLPSDEQQTVIETPTERLAATPPVWEQARAQTLAVFTRLNAWRKQHMPRMRPSGNGPVGVRLAWLRSWRVIFALVFLVAFVAPLLSVGVGAYAQYQQLKGWGTDGVSQLLSIKDLLPTTSTTTTKSGSGSSGITQKAQDILNTKTLGTIKTHCLAAESDFTRINNAIAHRDGVIGFAMGTSYKSKILAVQQVSLIGIDATVLCDELTSVGLDFTNSFATSPFSSEGGPILTQKSFADVQQGLNDTQILLTDIQAHVKNLNLKDVPVNKTELASLQKYLGDIPKALSYVATVQPFVPLAGWALGVGSIRNYLVLTMDRGELRPSGGFNGQFGLLTVNGGRLSKITLDDTGNSFDYTPTNKAYGQLAPSPYQAWWPWGNWGLRDANLSGDFPTSAQLSMSRYDAETGAPKDGPMVDGVISLSPVVIEHLLDPKVLGPLTLPCYNVTITSANLEDEIHYFQLSSAGQALQDKCSSLTNTDTSARKKFTLLLAYDLQNELRSASQATLLSVLNSFRQDLLTKDLEIYVTNTQIEALLQQHRWDASILRTTTDDSSMIVQANIGINKGFTQVTETTNEYIQLDDSGGAYHDLIISLDYHPTLDVYGLETIRDYMRVYVPAKAQFIDGSGFDQNIQPMYQLTLYPQPQKPLCVASPTPLPTPKPSPTPKTAPTPKASTTAAPTGSTPQSPAYHTTMIAPQAAQSPQGVAAPTGSPFPCTPAEAPACYQTPFGASGSLGASGSWDEHTEGSNNSYIDDIGEPTNFVSDVSGRAMYGGLVVIPAFCTATVELQWYVPGIAGKGASHNLPYDFIHQKQSGTNEHYTIQIAPASDSGAAPIKQSLTLAEDTGWTLSLKLNHALLTEMQRPTAHHNGIADLFQILLPENRWRL